MTLIFKYFCENFILQQSFVHQKKEAEMRQNFGFGSRKNRIPLQYYLSVGTVPPLRAERHLDPDQPALHRAHHVPPAQALQGPGGHHQHGEQPRGGRHHLLRPTSGLYTGNLYCQIVRLDPNPNPDPGCTTYL